MFQAIEVNPDATFLIRHILLLSFMYFPNFLNSFVFSSHSSSSYFASRGTLLRIMKVSCTWSWSDTSLKLQSHRQINFFTSSRDCKQVVCRTLVSWLKIALLNWISHRFTIVLVLLHSIVPFRRVRNLVYFRRRPCSSAPAPVVVVLCVHHRVPP